MFDQGKLVVTGENKDILESLVVDGLIIENGDQLRALEWHEPVVARANFHAPPVRKREPVCDKETYTTGRGETKTAFAGIDYIVTYADGSLGSPRKQDIFHLTYEETEPGSGLWVKKSRVNLFRVPDHLLIIAKTREGGDPVMAPNWIAEGIRGEVYENSPEHVSKLEILKDSDGVTNDLFTK